MLERIAELRAQGRIRIPGNAGRARQSAEAGAGPALRSSVARARRRSRRPRGAEPRRHCSGRGRRPSLPSRCAWPRQRDRAGCSWWAAASRRERPRMPAARAVARRACRTRAADRLICGRGVRRPPGRGPDARAEMPTQAACASSALAAARWPRGPAAAFPDRSTLQSSGFASSRSACRSTALSASPPTAVVAARPDVLVIIDSPDFTHRVARRVRAATPCDSDRQLRVAVGLGVAAGARTRDAGLCRPRACAAAVRAGTCMPRLGGPPCSYVGSSADRADRASCGPMPTRAHAGMTDPPVLLVLPGSRRWRNPPDAGRLRRTPSRCSRPRRAVRGGVPTRPAFGPADRSSDGATGACGRASSSTRPRSGRRSGSRARRSRNPAP